MYIIPNLIEIRPIGSEIKHENKHLSSITSLHVSCVKKVQLSQLTSSAGRADQPVTITGISRFIWREIDANKNQRNGGNSSGPLFLKTNSLCAATELSKQARGARLSPPSDQSILYTTHPQCTTETGNIIPRNENPYLSPSPEP